MSANPFPVSRERHTNTSCPGSALQELHAKQAIVSDVIDGRLPLVEAAARFQAAWRSANGIDDGETACRTVIGWVHLTLSAHPEQADRVSDRLERELQTHLERAGNLSVPVLN